MLVYYFCLDADLWMYDYSEQFSHLMLYAVQALFLQKKFLPLLWTEPGERSQLKIVYDTPIQQKLSIISWLRLC